MLIIYCLTKKTCIMKVLKKIKLNQLSKVELEKREMDALKGGNDCGDCTCSCYGGWSAYSATPTASHINTATAYVPLAGR